MDLTALPIEVLLEIVKNLPFKEKLQVAEVCKLFDDVVHKVTIGKLTLKMHTEQVK